jgi:signal transduction histidine kinase
LLERLLWAMGSRCPLNRTRVLLPYRLADFAELVTAALANVDAREQLAASRARIVQAGYEERRRLGRDLHDGAQQELVGAVMSLKLAQRRLARAPDEAGELLDGALRHMETGIRELRELAAGIHPSILTNRGLGAALEALATRSPMPVELVEVAAQRLPAPVETSGVGGATPSAGSGLRGLADRVSALGGRLEIESPAGEGTTVRARLALGSRETGERQDRQGGVTSTAQVLRRPSPRVTAPTVSDGPRVGRGR